MVDLHRAVITDLRFHHPSVELPLLYNEIFQPSLQIVPGAVPAGISAQSSPVPAPVSVPVVSQPVVNHSPPVVEVSPSPPPVVVQPSPPPVAPERLSPDIIVPGETVSFGDLDLPGVNFSPYSHLAAYANMAGLEINADLTGNLHALQVSFKNRKIYLKLILNF